MDISAKATVSGGRFSDILEGGAGNDRLNGGAGDDTLLATAGNDTIIGGADDDILRFRGSSLNFVIGLGDDGVILVRNRSTGDLTTIDPSVEKVAFGNGVADFGDIRSVLRQAEQVNGVFEAEEPQRPTQRSELLVGDRGADRIAARGGFDRVEGRGGDDRLNGGGGRDTLFGDSGRDRLVGAAGDDSLIGGAGRDTMIGGSGADAFVLEAAAGRDRIVDFGRGADRIEFLSGAESFADLTLVQRGDNTVIRFDGGSAILLDTDATSLSADDFLF